MSGALQLVNRYEQKTITVGEFMLLFDVREYDRKVANILRMREEFRVNSDATTDQQITVELCRFHAHVRRWFSRQPTHTLEGKPLTSEQQQLLATLPPPTIAPEVVVQELQHWYGGELREAKHKALFQQEGGIIGVINRMQETLIKEHWQAWIKTVFLQYLPVDDDVRFRLAEELLEQYGRTLFPNGELKSAMTLGANIEQVITDFAMRLHQIQRAWCRC